MKIEERLQGNTQSRVLVFPALTPKVASKQIHFLFSLSQVADIVRIAPVHPVPFSPPFVEGVTRWRRTVLPVISLEACLGLASPGPRDVRRRMVVRVAGDASMPGKSQLCMFDVGPATRMLSLPIECTEANGNSGWIPQRELIRGVYDWAEGFVVVAHLEKVLAAGSGNMQLPMPEAQRAAAF